MRNVAFLAAGMGLLLLQGNLFRALDEMPQWGALAVWMVALVIDGARMIRRGTGPTRAVAAFRADLLLPATVLLVFVLLASFGHARAARPIPALVLPLILFMGVHEYSLVRGALISFVIGYVTDVFGIAPVGLYTFTYVGTFVLARAAGVRLAAQTMWMQVLLVGAFALLQSIMVLVLLAIFGRDPWVPKSLYPLMLPHAIATAAVAPLIFRIAEALHTTGGTDFRVEAETGSAS
jgi:rod shape-determining protein MreD